MIEKVLVVLLGAALIVWTLNDAFQAVVVPRATGRRYRMSFFFWRIMWKMWPKIAWRLYATDDDRREDFFAIFAPLMLVAMLGLWVFALIFGFGLMLWGMHDAIAPPHASLGTTLYFAATSMLTIG
ncbi:MAG: hypothetical protein JO324_03125, partial [Candidatus Eremiobacteraeota bacterium]|nr:hypothetical protein [Candidatus Eremiobacteraeota bacterium]